MAIVFPVAFESEMGRVKNSSVTAKCEQLYVTDSRTIEIL